MPKISGVDTSVITKVNGITVGNISKINGISGLFGASPTPTPTNTPTPSITPTRTVTPTVTPSITPTRTVTPTVTPSVTPSITPTRTVTPTVTPSITPSITPTRTVTPTVTPSITPTETPTPTPTPSSAAACNYVLLQFGNTIWELCNQSNIQYFYINGTDLSNTTSVYSDNNCTNPQNPVYLRDGTGYYYWNGSSLSSTSCPPCYGPFSYYAAAMANDICNSFGGTNFYYVDDSGGDLSISTVIYMDCGNGQKAPAGYYSVTQGSGADVYYWDGNTTLSYNIQCP